MIVSFPKKMSLVSLAPLILLFTRYLVNISTTIIPSPSTYLKLCSRYGVKRVVITVADKFKCAEKNGVFPFPRDRSKYIQCNNGTKIVLNCPEGQVFDHISKFCEWKTATLHSLG